MVEVGRGFVGRSLRLHSSTVADVLIFILIRHRAEL